jgi:ketosteroid isomerase-like protein
MSGENVEIVRRIFDSWAKGDLRGGADHFDPQVMFIVPPPYFERGVFVGAEAISGYMRDLLKQYDRLAFEAQGLQAAGDTVLADVIQHNKGKASGVEVDNRLFMLFSFRSGKIIRFEIVPDETEALEAAGLSE